MSRRSARKRKFRRLNGYARDRDQWQDRSRRYLFALIVLLGAVAFVGIGVLLGAALYVYNYYASGLVPPEQALEQQARGGAKILDRQGRLLYQFVDDFGGLRQPLPLEEISPWLRLATISTEDVSFYDNPGINIRGLIRAALENFLPGQGAKLLEGSGGSSITQQLVKNIYISPEERAKRSIPRKIKESVLALELTRSYSKDQILEWYLNQIFYGNNAYGVGAAAERYFGKRAKDLTLAEAALLAGLPQSPTDYDPFTNFAEAKERQAMVLDLMVDHGLLSKEEAETAKQEELHFAERRFPIEAPHFVFSLIEADIKARFGPEALYRSGLIIHTTIDLDFQKEVETILEEEIRTAEAQQCGCHNGAVVVIRPESGEVLAYMGSRDYWHDQIEGRNDNLQAIKQPGSSFKPVVYLSYFMTQHAGPGSVVWATPYRPGGIEIQDPVRGVAGPLPVRIALGSSLNIPAAKAAAITGPENVIRTAMKLGYTTMKPGEPYGPSIATGGANLKLFEHTYAFATLANNGEMRGQRAVRNYGDGMRKIDPAVILRIEDNRGKLLYQFDPKAPAREQVVPANYSYLVTHILSDCNARYLIWSCGYFDIGRPYAVKTGTQQGLEQRLISSTLYNWQVGYTPDLTVGVWIGNQDNKPVSSANFETANAANRVWRRVMLAGHRGLPARAFTRPPGVVSGPVPAIRPGGGSSTACTGITTDLFASGDSSNESCVKVRVDKRNGLLASETTPPEFIEERGYLRVPREEEAWARANGWFPPTERSTEANIPARLDQPQPGATIVRSVLIAGRAASGHLTAWSVEVGEGPNPSAWRQIGGGTTPIEGALALLDAASLRPGPHMIRLTVHDAQLGTVETAIPVTVTAAAPTPAATTAPTPAIRTATPAPPLPVPTAPAVVPPISWSPQGPASRFSLPPTPQR